MTKHTRELLEVLKLSACIHGAIAFVRHQWATWKECQTSITAENVGKRA